MSALFGVKNHDGKCPDRVPHRALFGIKAPEASQGLALEVRGFQWWQPLKSKSGTISLEVFGLPEGTRVTPASLEQGRLRDLAPAGFDVTPMMRSNPKLFFETLKAKSRCHASENSNQETLSPDI